jgi:hypothetical protein
VRISDTGQLCAVDVVFTFPHERVIDLINQKKPSANAEGFTFD